VTSQWYPSDISDVTVNSVYLLSMHPIFPSTFLLEVVMVWLRTGIGNLKAISLVSSDMDGYTLSCMCWYCPKAARTGCCGGGGGGGRGGEGKGTQGRAHQVHPPLNGWV